MPVEVLLLDGVCITTQETLGRIRLPWLLTTAQGQRYIGRPKSEFEYVVDLVRNGDEVLQDDCHHEARFLYGLDGRWPGPVILLNVGGMLIHLREAVARSIPYLDAAIRWQTCSSNLDLSDQFLDRNPTKFRALLECVESGATVSDPGVIKEAMFWGVDVSSPSPAPQAALSQALPADATVALMACDFQDPYLHGDPYVTVHRQKDPQRAPKSAFTFQTVRLQPSGSMWKTTIPMSCDGLGDCWLNLDLPVALQDIPSDLWGRCRMVDKVTITLDGYSQETTGATLFTLMTMTRLHEAMVMCAGADVARLVIPLPTYWWNLMGVKPPLKMLQGPCTVTCHMASPWALVEASLTYTAWCYSNLDKKDQGSVTVVMHDTASFCTAFCTSSFVHSQTLGLHGHTRQIAVLVRGRQGQTNPVMRLDLLLNGTIHMSVDGGFAGRVLPRHLYGVDNTQPLYILPFDYRSPEPAFVVSACSMKNLAVELRLELLPGQYDVFVTALVVNMVRYVNRRLGVMFK